MIRVKATSNIAKFSKNFDEIVRKKLAEAANPVVKSFLLSTFEIVLSNTPTDTGQLMQNWHVYKHGGLRGFTKISGTRHDRFDMAGRLATHESTKASHMMALEAELDALDIKLFDENRTQVTIGLSNATPYAPMLDKGLYRPVPPLVNLTAEGYSVQAPSGIVQVSINEIQDNASALFNQSVSIGGSA